MGRGGRRENAVKLPNGADATVGRGKVEDYLLSRTHPTGRFKARFFRVVGLDDPVRLREALTEVARTGTVRERIPTEHGTKYVVEGELETPEGNRVPIRTVWILEHGREAPRLVTAYPG